GGGSDRRERPADASRAAVDAGADPHPLSACQLAHLPVREDPGGKGQPASPWRVVLHLQRRTLGHGPKERRFRASQPRLEHMRGGRYRSPANPICLATKRAAPALAAAATAAMT